MPKFIGIDHNTKKTGIFAISLEIDKSNNEILTHCFSEVIKTNGGLQKRLFDFRQSLFYFFEKNFIERNDFLIAREKHHHTGEKIIQMSMATGVLDEFLFSKGYKIGENYFEFTPAQWRLITFGDQMLGFGKKTKKEEIEYCGFFNEMFDIAEHLEFKDSDLADSFGLAYSLACCYLYANNEKFKLAQSDKRSRNINLWLEGNNMKNEKGAL